MADLGETFETEKMDLGSDLLPEGQYIAQVIEEVDKDTANGKMVTFTFEILDGEFEGRRFWHRYNYINANADAQRIARKELGRFARAAGVVVWNNTEALHFKPVLVDVIVRKGNNGYQDSNEVKSNGYNPIGAASEQQPRQRVNHNPSTARSTHNGGSAATQAPQRQSGGGSRPWARQSA